MVIEIEATTKEEPENQVMVLYRGTVAYNQRALGFIRDRLREILRGNTNVVSYPVIDQRSFAPVLGLVFLNIWRRNHYKASYGVSYCGLNPPR
nr:MULTISPECIES: hypothetical protein [Cryobacterium]